MHEQYLQFAKKLALKGGAILKENFGKLKQNQVQNKGDHDIVTKADHQIESLYRHEIQKKFPTHGIIGEEGTSINPENEWIWILDPLDGTKNYSIDNPFFCTTITLLRNKSPEIAVIYEPITNHLSYASKGNGAYLNENKIQVSQISEMKKSRLLYCHASDEKSIKEAEHYVCQLKIKSLDTSRLRSAGAEMALIAKGKSEAYLMNKLPLWDLAAGALIVTEAGGIATDLSGKKWKPGDSNILVSNGSKIHHEILKIINKKTS